MHQPADVVHSEPAGHEEAERNRAEEIGHDQDEGDPRCHLYAPPARGNRSIGV